MFSPTPWFISPVTLQQHRRSYSIAPTSSLSSPVGSSGDLTQPLASSEQRGHRDPSRLSRAGSGGGGDAPNAAALGESLLWGISRDRRLGRWSGDDFGGRFLFLALSVDFRVIWWFWMILGGFSFSISMFLIVHLLFFFKDCWEFHSRGWWLGFWMPARTMRQSRRLTPRRARGASATGGAAEGEALGLAAEARGAGGAMGQGVGRDTWSWSWGVGAETGCLWEGFSSVEVLGFYRGLWGFVMLYAYCTHFCGKPTPFGFRYFMIFRQCSFIPLSYDGKQERRVKKQ